ncbi:MAG: hypothetical protein CME31_24750 [Gimesia sp.]|jgi:hypothetical protein|nr:hypothetical protein [Gimesia sp.]|tara:strand:+ start:1100 stop:1384 length:285 start_codon:yes stop_codon:yes gene_type:complete
MKKKKPTVKQIGEFTLSIYEKVRQLETVAIGNSQAFLQYLEMNGEIDKFNEYLKQKIAKSKEESLDEEKTKHKTGKKKPTKRSRTTKRSSKASS